MNSYMSTTISIPEAGVYFRVETEVDVKLPLKNSFDIHAEKVGAIERKTEAMIKTSQETV